MELWLVGGWLVGWVWYAISMPTNRRATLEKGKTMTTVEQRIKSLEEAEVMWSRRWGNAMSEYALKQAESQIRIIQRRLAELKGKA